jgi:hypothetical protein
MVPLRTRLGDGSAIDKAVCQTAKRLRLVFRRFSCLARNPGRSNHRGSRQALAERLVERNQREGATFDQKWYAFRRFGEYLKLILRAESVLFYGGLEADVHTHIRSQYFAVTSLCENRDPGEIRLFAGQLHGGKWDCVVIGQNGREVALKTIIRLLYMRKFADDETKPMQSLHSPPFKDSLKAY